MVAAGWRVWLLGYVIVVLLASGVTALVVDLSQGRWDRRVEPLAAFVERARGLEFGHPVQVQFFDDDEFRREMRDLDEGPTATEPDEAEDATRLFRAAGLVSGDADLADSGTELVEEGVLALYDPNSQRVLVRDTDVGVKLDATLVHELTHALQDQHFDLSLVEEAETSGEQLAYRALLEGDADRIEYAYVGQQSSSDQDDYDVASGELPDLEGIPPALLSYFAAPYALGDQFVALVEEVGGPEGVDDAFENPPVSDEHLLDPFTYLDGDEPLPVDAPELRPGEEEFDAGDWGALTWLLMLGARIDPHVALDAVDGWGGDAYVAFERGRTACVRAAFVGDSDADTDEMGVALGQWAAAMPPGAASVGGGGDAVEVEACDPGTAASLSFAPGFSKILALPVARSQAVQQSLSQGLPRDAARCVGQTLVDTTSVEQLASSDPTSVDVAALVEKVQGIVTSCAPGR